MTIFTVKEAKADHVAEILEVDVGSPSTKLGIRDWKPRHMAEKGYDDQHFHAFGTEHGWDW